MAQLSLPGAAAPALTVVDGIPTTTSVDLARHFGKRHDDVLKAIRNLLQQLPEEHLRNFAEASVEVAQPNGGTATYPAYRITRDGFTLLAMGFTGQRALKFKLAYIDAFNRLERDLRERPVSIEHAYALALEVAQQAAQTVFQAVLAGDEGWKHARWMFCLNYDRDNRLATPWAKVIASDAHVASLSQLAQRINEPNAMLPSNAELANLAAACNQRLARQLSHTPTPSGA